MDQIEKLHFEAPDFPPFSLNDPSAPLVCQPLLEVAPRTVCRLQISASRWGNSAAIEEQQQLPDPSAVLTPDPGTLPMASQGEGVQFSRSTTITTLLQMSGQKKHLPPSWGQRAVRG